MKLVALLSILALLLSLAEGVMVCYYGSWAWGRQEASVDVEDLDPTICTHLIYSFAGLGDDNRIKVLSPWNDLCENNGRCAYDRFTALKQHNPTLLTLLSVGGWNEGSEKYSKMAMDPAKRKTFVDSSIELLKEHNFDGLDLDWEHPTRRGGVPEDRENFVLLLKDLKEGLSANGMTLTVAVSASKKIIDQAYDIPGIAQHVDVVNLMSYAFHGMWNSFTHHHSGLYAHPSDTGDALSLNQDFAVKYWLAGGLPGEKLALGVPLFARCWSLDSEDEHGYYAPASQPGLPGPYTSNNGTLGYFEVCEKIIAEGWTVVNDPAMHEPYVYHMPYGRIWCAYNHRNAAILKALYARDKGLGGLMVWSLESGDFWGKCGRKFDLVKTLVETFTEDATHPLPI